MPPLNALRQFEAAARHLSFRLAAEELHVTPSAVSHGVQALEEALGTCLFVRDRRGLMLTPAGAAYLPRIREGLDLLARASDVLPRGGEGTRRLSLSVAPSFASRWLIPNLPRFQKVHPGIEILLDTLPRHVEFPRDDVDLAIRRGHGSWPGLATERLMHEELVPVCLPAIAEGIRSVADLSSQTLLHVTATSEDWASWARLSGNAELDLDRGLRVDTIEMAWSAAMQGLGIAIGRLPLVGPDLAEGRLAPVLGPPVRGEVGYWLTTVPAALRRREVAIFRDWLMDELAPVRGQQDASCA